MRNTGSAHANATQTALSINMAVAALLAVVVVVVMAAMMRTLG